MINQEKLKARRKRNYLKKREDRLAYRKEYYEKNKEHIIKKSCDWAKDNPEKRKRNYLKSTYNISLEDYKLMMENQQERCFCCGKHKDDLTKGLFVDHCHETGRVRGLLCATCNLAIGYVNDDISILENMIKYLKNAK